MSLYCNSCHHENLDIALYCGKCGNKLKVKTYEEENIDEKLINQIQMWTILTIIFVFLSFIYFSSSENVSVVKPKKIINEVSQNNFNYKEIETKKEFSLNVKVNPSKSKIKILNITEPYYENMKLKKGKYHIEVSKEGYKTFKKWILLEDDAHVTASLEKDNTWKCNIQWIIDKGEKFKPTNENLQTISIELIDNIDRLYLKTQNGESKYEYSSFIDVEDNNLGMEYIYGNRFIGIFQDGTLLMGDIKSGIDTKYYCKDMTLDITKSNSPMTVKTMEKQIIPITPKSIIPKATSIEKFSLTVQKTPSSARVRILNIKPKYYDGIRLKKGKYHIEISKKGYETFDKWVSLEKNQVFEFKLKKNKVYVPQNNTVFENNSYTKKTSIVQTNSSEKPNMSHLPRETKNIIENACNTEKYTGGASKYYNCIQTQLNQLGNKKKPNMSYLPKETKNIIENACNTEKYTGGASKYYNCIQTQLNQL